MWTWIRRDETDLAGNNAKELTPRISEGQNKSKLKKNKTVVKQTKGVIDTDFQRRAVSWTSNKTRRTVFSGCRSAGPVCGNPQRDKGIPRQQRRLRSAGGIINFDGSSDSTSGADSDSNLEVTVRRQNRGRRARGVRTTGMSVKSDGTSSVAVMAVSAANGAKPGVWDTGSTYSSSASASSRGGVGPDLGLLNMQWLPDDDNLESFDEALRARRKSKLQDPTYSEKSSDTYKKVITDLVDRGIIQERNKNVTFVHDLNEPEGDAADGTKVDLALEAVLQRRRINAKRGWGIVRRKMLELKLERRQSNSFQGWAMLTKHARAMSDIERARADLYDRYGFDENLGPGELPDNNPMAIKKNINATTAAKLKKINQMAQMANAKRAAMV